MVHRIYYEKIYIYNQATRRIIEDNKIPVNIKNLIINKIIQIEKKEEINKIISDINLKNKNVLDLGNLSEFLYDLSCSVKKYCMNESQVELIINQSRNWPL